MRSITYLDSLKKVNEQITNNEIIKVLFIDLIKLCINKKDYLALVEKTADMFYIPSEDAQFLLFDISRKDNLENAWSEVGKELHSLLRLVALTYGEMIGEIRRFTLSKDKLLVTKSSLSNYDDKIGVNFKRIDGESFYFEMNFNGMVSFALQVVNVFRENIEKNRISNRDKDLFDQALQLRAAGTLLTHSFDRDQTAKDGDNSGHGIDK